MGPSKVRDRIPDLISRACRLPRKVADRVSELSDTIYNEHLRPLQSKTNFPYKFLSIAILLLMFLPSLMLFTFAIPPQVELTPSNEVDNTAYCDIRPIPEDGVTHAVLLNNTPFSPGNGWDADFHWFYPDYDINRYTNSEPDGYHMEFRASELSLISFNRRMQIPIINYSDVSIFIEVEKVSGTAGLYLEVFVDEEWKVVESSFETSSIVQLNVSAPLVEARQKAISWLSTLSFRFQIGSYDGAQVIIRRAVIEATFTAKLSHAQIDVQSTENASLYDNLCMKYLSSAPNIMIIRNNDTNSAAMYSPERPRDELYLSPGVYTGMAYWRLFAQESPDPNNATTWKPNVNFTVLEDTALEIDVRLYAMRLDIDVSPNVLLHSLYILLGEDNQYFTWYSISQEIFGSTLYYSLPDFLYIPGGIGSLTASLTTWSAFSPRTGGESQPNQAFWIYTEAYLDTSNSSRNLRLNVALPYVTFGDAALGLGDFVLFAVEGLLLIGFAITLHRALRNSDLRHRLSDSRVLPIALLGLSIFLPWSTQLSAPPSMSYPSVYRISWFSMPFMIRWTDSTAIQLLCATPDWWNASLISTFLLFVPLFYACLSLPTPETGAFDRKFAFALFLPYLVVLSGFSFSVLSADTISVGPLLAIAALPVWSMRIALRRLGLTK